MTHARGGSFAARAGFLEALPLVLPDLRLSLLCAYRGDRLVGAVMLAVTRKWGHRFAYSLPFGTYGGPLVDAEEAEPALVSERLAMGVRMGLVDLAVAGGEIVRAPAQGELSDPAWSAFASDVTPGTTHVLSLEGRTFDEYAAALRHETRKDLRHAAREGVQVREEPAALTEAYALYRGQAKAWRGHRPYPLLFLQALLDHPSRFARLYAARRGGELLSAILALSCGTEVFLWWSGSSPESRRALAYPYLIVEIVRAASASGATRVNIGSSGGIAALERFKDSLGATSETYWTYRLASHATGVGFKLLMWARTLRRSR